MKCKIIDQCGGCDFSHSSLNPQNEYKNKYIEQIFENIGEPNQLISMEYPYYYRNKVLRTYQRKGKNDLISGIYSKGTHRLVEIENCLIEEKTPQKILETIKSIAKKYKMEPYNEDRESGLLRHVMIRQGHNSKEIMVILVLSNTYFTGKKNFVKTLRGKHPEITTIVVNYNKRKSSVVLEGEFETIFGPGFIYDTLCGIKFKISPGSFYQVNSIQTEILYNQAIEMAQFSKEDRILDAYCGIGTIGMIAASKVKEVIGIENNVKAVKDANINKKINNIENIKFINQDATQYLTENSNQHFDKIIMDPPRAGSTEEFLQAVIKINPEKIIYISCNPQTQARDIEYLKNHYQVETIQPVDMFPFTKHVETVALLSKLDVDRHIDVIIEMDELDITAAESKATYEEIKEYILGKFKFKVSTLYIAQINRKCGIDLRAHYNISKKENQRVPQCPQEKEEAIMDALRHFKMI